MTRKGIEKLLVERISAKLSGEPIDVTRTPKEHYELTNANGAIIVRTSRGKYQKQGNQIFTKTLTVEIQIWYTGVITDEDDTLYKYADLVRQVVTTTASIGGSLFEPVDEAPLGYVDEAFIFGMLFQADLPYILGQ